MYQEYEACVLDSMILLFVEDKQIYVLVVLLLMQCWMLPLLAHYPEILRLDDGPDIKLFILVGLGRSFFVCSFAHRGSTVGFLCSSVPVMLFGTPGISGCRSQHVPVESSSLLHHSIYLWFICFPWWSIDELENLHADRTTVCFEPW